MTQKEKAKAYDELLDKAKQIYNKENDVLIKHIIEGLFPELKESEDERIRKNLIGYIKDVNEREVCKETLNEWVAWLEKQGEQKPADKVEPKFKVGDWVVSPNGVYWHIDAIQNGRYEVTADTGQCGNWPLDTNIYRLWTIQDAKAGDVLANDHHILILRELGYSWAANGNPDSLYAYCGIKPNGNFELEQKGYCFCGTLHTHPATKEQCDTLMKAMADAGYTFDFEKKELRKIDWNPQPGDTFRKKGTISPTYHLCAKREDGVTFGFVENNEVCISGGEITIFALRNDYELVERLKPIENIIKEEFNKVVSPNDAWSEEDEKIAKTIINEFEQCSEWYCANGLTKEDCIAWLNRQIHAKWSEEDKKKVNNLYVLLDQMVSFNMLSNKDASEFKDWLKFLKERYTWKPSDEQIKALEKACDKHWESDGLDPLYTLYQDLKKLMEE